MASLISFLVPVKNESAYVKEAVASVLAVTDVDIELIIVDDGSTDSTCDIVRSFSDPRVRLFYNSSKGKVAALNRAYREARGDAFILFAGDDILVADAVRERVDPLFQEQSHPAVSLCKVKMFSDNPKFDGIIIPKHKGRGAETGGAMAFNARLARLIFPIPEQLPNEDTWIKNYLEAGFCSVVHVPRVGLSYRIHDNNSMKRDVSYTEFSRNLHVRERANEIFYERYKDALAPRARRVIAQRCSAQADRYLGKTFRILFYFDLSLRERASLVFYSQKFLYRIRTGFYSFFSGR